MTTKNIFLVGFMGAGKTTIGRLLSRELGLVFKDSDHEIESRSGASVSCIFEVEGEKAFRHREASVIDDLTRLGGIVLATGGGCILSEINRKNLQERGTVIYLQVGADEILHRTRRDRSRPLLRVVDTRKKIEEMLLYRDPLYREVADFIVDSGRTNSKTILKTILNYLDSLDIFPPQINNIGSWCLSMNTADKAVISLCVELERTPYFIRIGSGVMNDTEYLRDVCVGNNIVIVTNEVVAPLYLKNFETNLVALGKTVFSIILPDGEVEKTWVNLMRIFDFLLSNKCDRKTTLFALGGGVIGDLTGYAAASYMRGVPFVQVPTTLLSQVDASVGGKTGINHPLGKNMIGAFYQPKAVLIDTSTLNTLPERELIAGLAEIIKCASVLDIDFFEWIEINLDKIKRGDRIALSDAIASSCRIKADVVRQDEREDFGLREALNFGHTFGHAIEVGLGYGRWLHGEAVGCGMVMAADLAVRLELISKHEQQRVFSLIKAAGLPTRAPNFGEDRWVELMCVDKKNQGGNIRFILPNPLGKFKITTVEEALLRQTLAACTL